MKACLTVIFRAALRPGGEEGIICPLLLHSVRTLSPKSEFRSFLNLVLVAEQIEVVLVAGVGQVAIEQKIPPSCLFPPRWKGPTREV